MLMILKRALLIMRRHSLAIEVQGMQHSLAILPKAIDLAEEKARVIESELEHIRFVEQMRRDQMEGRPA